MNNIDIKSILPNSTRNAIGVQMDEKFRSTLKLPKGMNRHMIARAIDRIFLEKMNIAQVKSKMGLVSSEVEYLTAVIAEFRAWELIQTESN